MFLRCLIILIIFAAYSSSLSFVKKNWAHLFILEDHIPPSALLRENGLIISSRALFTSMAIIFSICFIVLDLFCYNLLFILFQPLLSLPRMNGCLLKIPFSIQKIHAVSSFVYLIYNSFQIHLEKKGIVCQRKEGSEGIYFTSLDFFSHSGYCTSCI